MKGLNLTGKRFGRLVVIKQTGIDNKSRQKLWLCKCDCGNKKITKTSYLTSGDTSSCGCYRKESELRNFEKARINGVNKTHGLSKTRLYTIWAGIKNRCYCSNNKNYRNYGGRGIRVCDEWKNNFVFFYNWSIKNGYKDNLTIDRIDVNGNYEPNNCRWITMKEQAHNKRNTRKITIMGKTKTVYEFEKEYKVKAWLLADRYDKGYRDEMLIYKGNLGHFVQKTYKRLKRDKKGRFLPDISKNVNNMRKERSGGLDEYRRMYNRI